MGQVYQCWWRICREINVFFSRFEYHMFYVISICDLFTDSSSYIKLQTRFSEIQQACLKMRITKWQLVVSHTEFNKICETVYGIHRNVQIWPYVT
jgi:hypothetical protein